MKKNSDDISKMRTATVDEINSKILELKRSLMKSRFELSSGQLKDVSVIKIIRRNIAKLLTYLRLKKINNL